MLCSCIYCIYCIFLRIRPKGHSKMYFLFFYIFEILRRAAPKYIYFTTPSAPQNFEKYTQKRPKKVVFQYFYTKSKFCDTAPQNYAFLMHFLHKIEILFYVKFIRQLSFVRIQAIANFK